MPVSQLTTADVITVIMPICHTKAATARGMKGGVSSIMRWVIAQNHIENHPVERRRRSARAVLKSCAGRDMPALMERPARRRLLTSPDDQLQLLDRATSSRLASISASNVTVAGGVERAGAGADRIHLGSGVGPDRAQGQSYSPMDENPCFTIVCAKMQHTSRISVHLFTAHLPMFFLEQAMADTELFALANRGCGEAKNRYVCADKKLCLPFLFWAIDIYEKVGYNAGIRHGGG